MAENFPNLMTGAHHYRLYDSNYMPLWKRQSYKDSLKRSVAARDFEKK